ncbi:hypothetical protein BDP81DRAFT_513222, partial [Colletotrichum phormii]
MAPTKCHHTLPTLHDGTLKRSTSYDGKIDAARPHVHNRPAESHKVLPCQPAVLRCPLGRIQVSRTLPDLIRSLPDLIRSLERYKLQVLLLLFSISLHDSDQSRDFPRWRSGGGARVHKVKSLTQMLVNRRVDAPELQRQSSLLAFHDVAYPSPMVAIPLHRHPIRPSTCCQH